MPFLPARNLLHRGSPPRPSPRHSAFSLPLWRRNASSARDSLHGDVPRILPFFIPVPEGEIYPGRFVHFPSPPGNRAFVGLTSTDGRRDDSRRIQSSHANFDGAARPPRTFRGRDAGRTPFGFIDENSIAGRAGERRAGERRASERAARQADGQASKTGRSRDPGGILRRAVERRIPCRRLRFLNQSVLTWPESIGARAYVDTNTMMGETTRFYSR